MRAEIISVGTELLLGDIVNTNAQFLARELAGLGYGVYYQTVVGDNAQRLRDLVLEAKERSDILIFTGGLGPTDDDLTKETVADAFGDSLTLDAEELVKLEHFFQKRGAVMTENNRKQAMVPRHGRKLPNDNGTAPGAFFRQGSKYAILLPGPPREMKPMFTQQVLPLLEAMQDSSIRSVTLRVFGMGESALEEKVYSLLEGTNPTAALYAKTGEVHIRITAKAPTAEQADIMCDETAALFRAALGDLIYSYTGDNLETVAVGRLLADGYTVATAESCTGGLLGERITSVPGASGAYGFGAITYANETKHELLGVRNSTLRKYGAVSSQVAAEMAFGAAHKGDADFGVGITGIAGPDGGTAKKPVGLVYVAVSSGRRVYVKKLELGDRGRAYVRELATQHALDMLRRIAGGLPVPGAKTFTKSQLADYDREGKPQRRGGVLLRAVVAVLAAALVILAAVLLANRARAPGGGQQAASVGQSPNAQNLTYGTQEYTAAAMDYVQQSRSFNPAVTGYLAMPGGKVATLVAQTSNGKQADLADARREPGTEGMPLIAADAVMDGAGANPLLLGDISMPDLWDYQFGNMGDSLSTFTYFTAGDAQVYKVLAVYVADVGDDQGDSFDPAIRQVSGYGGFLSFLLGSKARSLYDIAVDTVESDAYMTLAALDPEDEGRRLYVLGRRLRGGEGTDTPAAATAGSPLMPTAWYAAADAQPPDVDELYDWWMQWYLTRGATNSRLQLAAGMPARDEAPTVSTTRQGGTFIPAQEDEAEEDASSPASNLSAVLLTATSTSQVDSSASADSSTSEDSSTSQADGSGSDTASEPPVAAIYPRRVMPNPLPQKPDPGYLTVTMNGQIVTDTTANVLAQICQAEAGSLEPAAIKAVAICAHSWILNQQGAGNAAPAVVGSIPTEKVRTALAEVERLILSPDEANPAFTPWFAMAAQGTNSAVNVWGTDRAYLEGAPSPEQGITGWTQIVAVPADTLAADVLERLGIDLAAYSDDKNDWVGEVAKSENGYVETIELGGEAVSGFTLWYKVLTRDGQPLLPSPAFEVSFDGENFNFICYGQGHGAGLSLAGANAYAKQGRTYQAILENYFPGCTVITW